LDSTEPESVLPTLPIGIEGWCLRAWRPGDAASLARHADNLNVWRWMSDHFPHPYTLEIARHWAARGHVEFGGDNWAIACADEAVGGCGIGQLGAPLDCSAEVGWWLGEPFWGQGVATHVAQVLVARAFGNPRITRLFAPIHDGNQRSMRVARNAGFELEGVQRQSAFKAGQVIDRHIYARYRNLF
jgi:[ribosomal protein S5]-alanine N-acetyltransferase